MLKNVIYATTNEGYFIADVDEPNLIDFNKWSNYSSGIFSSIEIFNDEVYTAKGKSFYKISETKDLELIENIGSSIIKLKASSTNISVSAERKAVIYDVNLSNVQTIISDPDSEYYFKLNGKLVLDSSFSVLRS